LESLVKSILCLLNCELGKKLRKSGHNLNETLQIWEEIEEAYRESIYAELLELARQDQFDKLVAKLGFLFPEGKLN
jgi:hypothetical protein